MTSIFSANLQEGKPFVGMRKETGQSNLKKLLPVFKEFHSDLATDRISTRDDESDFEFDK